MAENSIAEGVCSDSTHPGRATEGHDIGPQRHMTNAPQRYSGSAPGQPGDAGAVADDVRLQAVVKHGPGGSCHWSGEKGKNMLENCMFHGKNICFPIFP